MSELTLRPLKASRYIAVVVPKEPEKVSPGGILIPKIQVKELSCRRCGGRGILEGNPCPACQGRGTVLDDSDRSWRKGFVACSPFPEIPRLALLGLDPGGSGDHIWPDEWLSLPHQALGLPLDATILGFHSEQVLALAFVTDPVFMLETGMEEEDEPDDFEEPSCHPDYRLLHGKILLKEEPDAEKTLDSGIVSVSLRRNSPRLKEVAAVGPGVRGIRKGDRVIHMNKRETRVSRDFSVLPAGAVYCKAVLE